MPVRISARGRGAALVALCGLYAGPIHAQALPATIGTTPKSAKPSADAVDAAEAADDANEAITVTGNRMRGSVVTDVPAEASINATAIRALGAADLDEVFADLAPEIQTGAGSAVRNGQAAAGPTPVVLVNGQRIAGFSSIKDLPPEAIRRIEIFPEQVALQYGYAADQRVVNVILRSRYRALTLLGRYTLAPDNLRGTYRGKVDLLRIGENSNWNIDLDYRHQDPILDDTTLAGPGATGPVPMHTLATQDDHLTITGSLTRPIGAVSAELTGSLDLDALQSRPGLSDEDGDLLAAEGLPDLISGPLDRVDRTAEAQASLTLNGRLDANWRWSFIGRLDETTHQIRTDRATGTGGLDTILLPSPGLIGDRCDPVADTDCVSTDVRTASGDAYLNGKLFALPAGSVSTSLRTGFVFSGIRSDSPLAASATDLHRNEGNVQANIDVPLTAARSPIGKLTVGVNGEVRHLSDFGTLATYGSTLDWAPSRTIDFLATYSHEQQAPTLLQLGEATLDTPDLREFDFVTDSTTIVQRLTGGTADLDHQTAQIAKFRLQLSPLRAADLQLSAEYTIERVRNPIADITAATAATMAAFPDRFVRDNGYLTALDVSPLNLARRDRQQLRWGLNYSTAFGAARPVAGTTTPARNQFQIALYDTWHLRDNVVLRDGQPTLDLLGHDIISDAGGTPTHQVELQTTVSTTAWSADINAVWQTPTSAYAGELSQDRLTFSQGVSLNARLQINLAEQRWLTRIFPKVKGSLNLSADNLLGAHTRVHDADGGVPAAYAQSYLNPTGRTFRITLRKRFR